MARKAFSTINVDTEVRDYIALNQRDKQSINDVLRNLLFLQNKIKPQKSIWKLDKRNYNKMYGKNS